MLILTSKALFGHNLPRETYLKSLQYTFKPAERRVTLPLFYMKSWIMSTADIYWYYRFIHKSYGYREKKSQAIYCKVKDNNKIPIHFV